MDSPESIPSSQIASRKVVGDLHGEKVIEITLKGGLNLIVSAKGGKVAVYGSGSHRGIARHIAKKKEPDIQFNELSKSDWIDPAHFASLLPKYEALTEMFCKACETE